MKFSAALAAAVLSATTVMAAPGTAARRDRRVARRAAGVHKSQPFIRANSNGATNGPEDLNIEYSSNWAGAALVGSGYTGVTGTFTVPTPSEPSGGSSRTTYSSSAWVGLDGYTCETAILQTGLDFTVEGTSVSYDAWYEWYPDYAYDFSGISFSAGDSVTLTIKATSKTAGTATIKNNTKGTTVTHTFSGESDALCETNAEWIVEDYEEDGSLVPLADFGTVTFTNAYATTASGTVGVTNAQIIEIENSSDKVVADVTIAGSEEVIIKYV